MADESQTQTETAPEQDAETGHDASNGGADGGGRHTALRAVAIVAAGGATALAARKALSDRHRAGSEERQEGDSSNDESLFASMFNSGWDSARTSLLPMAEEAATSAGEYVGEHGPEIVRETLVPRFISGFEKARKQASQE
jgi:hypothetical protein